MGISEERGERPLTMEEFELVERNKYYLHPDKGIPLCQLVQTGRGKPTPERQILDIINQIITDKAAAFGDDKEGGSKKAKLRPNYARMMVSGADGVPRPLLLWEIFELVKRDINEEKENKAKEARESAIILDQETGRTRGMTDTEYGKMKAAQERDKEDKDYSYTVTNGIVDMGAGFEGHGAELANNFLRTDTATRRREYSKAPKDLEEAKYFRLKSLIENLGGMGDDPIVTNEMIGEYIQKNPKYKRAGRGLTLVHLVESENGHVPNNLGMEIRDEILEELVTTPEEEKVRGVLDNIRKGRVKPLPGMVSDYQNRLELMRTIKDRLRYADVGELTPQIVLEILDRVPELEHLYQLERYEAQAKEAARFNKPSTLERL